MSLAGLRGEYSDPTAVLQRVSEERRRVNATSTDLSDLGTADSWFLVETSFNVPSSEPYVIRVRAEHVAGGVEKKTRSSRWAYVSAPVKASCQFNRFMPDGLGL